MSLQTQRNNEESRVVMMCSLYKAQCFSELQRILLHPTLLFSSQSLQRESYSSNLRVTRWRSLNNKWKDNEKIASFNYKTCEGCRRISRLRLPWGPLSFARQWTADAAAACCRRHNLIGILLRKRNRDAEFYDNYAKSRQSRKFSDHATNLIGKQLYSWMNAYVDREREIQYQGVRPFDHR